MLKLTGQSMVSLKINEQNYTLAVRPADTLLHVLREMLGLTGAKNGCDNGDCGACTVLLDGMPVKACQTLAAEAVGHAVTTVESLHNTPLQEAFVRKFALQCGFCTPGLIMTCHGLIQKYPEVSEAVLTEWLEAGTCRCTGYQEIKEAVQWTLQQG